MLTAEPKGFFGRSYTILENGTIMSVLTMSVWKEKAEIELAGKHYRFKRDGALRGAFLLLEQNNVLAYATKPSAFRQRFEIKVDGKEYVLRKPSIWRREFSLEEGSELAGKIRRMGFFSRKSAIELPEELPLVVRIFVFWLVLLMWQRERAAAASS